MYRYDAFGAPTFYDYTGAQVSTPPYNNRFMFTGREYASTFGFYEYRARAYHPTLGRFMSEDPKLFDAGDYNLYRYCHNDPLDLTDPMGLLDIPNVWNPRWLAPPDPGGHEFEHTPLANAMAQQAATTAQLHASIGYNEAAGLHGSLPRTMIEGPGPVKIDVDGRGPDHGDPFADKNHQTSYKPNGKSLNADKDKYVAASRSTREACVRMGDRGLFFANGRMTDAVVGDARRNPGVEASLAAVHAVGIPTKDVRGVGPVPNISGGRDVTGTVIFYPSGQPGP